MNDIVKLSEYRDWLRDLKQQIKTGQIKAALSVNSQMIMLYWDMGCQIAEKQKKTKWGSGFIEQLSKDLREEFPEMTGFSRTNLFRMKRFYQFYSPIIQQDKFVPQLVGQLDNSSSKCMGQFVPQLVEQIQITDNQDETTVKQLFSKLVLIPWGHNVSIIEKAKEINQALFYINKTIENNWSRAVLEYQIETNLYGRKGKAITNFNLTLPAPQSDLANEIMKDPLILDFFWLGKQHQLSSRHCGLDPQSPKERRKAA